MQSLLDASNSAPGVSDEACAGDLLDAVPRVMRVIRLHLRRHRSGLSVPQFRTLWFVSTASVPTLSEVADFIGLSLPAMSRLADGLVARKLVRRRTCEKDRRHVRLSLTPAGRATLAEARQLAKAHMAQALAPLTAEQKGAVSVAMGILQGVFAPESPAPDEGGVDVAGD